MQKAKRKNVLRDAFGHLHFLKRSLIFIFGIISYSRYNGFNKLTIKGTEQLVDLPSQNVLFVSNHQTYFADVFAMFHVFCSLKNGFINTIKNPIYLLNPKIDLYYIAAEETMKNNFLSKLFAYTGAITVKRTWRAAGKEVNRKVDLNEVDNIHKALENGWVITFPQGTTRAFAPGRKGTAHLIKRYQPIVVPVVIDGFRRSFDKKGLIMKKKGIQQKITFKAPLVINYETEDTQDILDKIMQAIEQAPEFLKVPELENPKEPESFY